MIHQTPVTLRPGLASEHVDFDSRSRSGSQEDLAGMAAQAGAGQSGANSSELANSGDGFRRWSGRE